jgi:hypothetical protein
MILDTPESVPILTQYCIMESIVSPLSSMDAKTANETARDAFSIHSFAHGSSHTSYVVQPLQAHPIPASVFYANMPSAPPNHLCCYLSIWATAFFIFEGPHHVSITTKLFRISFQGLFGRPHQPFTFSPTRIELSTCPLTSPGR